MGEELSLRLERAGRRRRALAAGVVRGDVAEVAAWSRSPEEVDERSLFEIGSLTKPITGILLALMQLEGEVDLADPISDYLADEEMPRWRDRPPTLEELATHRAALPNVPAGLSLRELAYVGGLRERDPWAAIDADAYRAAVRRTKAKRAPGGRAGYSSLGYGLLGEALAARAQTSFEQLLRAKVLLPLGLEETAITVAESQRPRLLDGHSARGKPRPPLEDLMPAAGGLRSTAAEMTLLLQACLRPPSTRLGEAVRVAQQPRARVGRRHSIGLGWLVSRRRGGISLTWHNGGTWGFRSFAGFIVADASAAVVLSNTARSVDRLGIGLVRD